MTELKIAAPEGEPLIVMTRMLAAPRKLVWKAWTDPVHVAQWWGPRGITTKVVKLDLRPGGTWRFEHHLPDGGSYAFKGTYLEVAAPEKVVNTFGMEGMFEDKLVVETHTFEEREGRTLYTSVSRFDTIEDRDGMIASGMEAGARESMDRLDELLATL